MKNTQDNLSAALGTSRCDYLGLKDDPQTCLAFPSKWNYCQHATPPGSVRLEYQRQYCQSTEHMQCLVFQREKTGPLPPEIRGKHVTKGHHLKAGVLIPALLLLIAFGTVFIWLAEVRGMFSSAGSGPFVQMPTAIPPIAAISFASSTAVFPTDLPLIPPLPSSTTLLPTLTAFSITHINSDSLPATITPVSTPVGVCGHQLDQPFGPGMKFIIHQVKYGDSLNMYEITYRTTVSVIEGVNYHPFTIPLRKDQVIVILLNQKELDGLPLFEPYLASNPNTSSQTMAFKVSSDLPTFEEYNGFDNSCRGFSGWLLAPHPRPSQ